MTTYIIIFIAGVAVGYYIKYKKDGSIKPHTSNTDTTQVYSSVKNSTGTKHPIEKPRVVSPLKRDMLELGDL